MSIGTLYKSSMSGHFWFQKIYRGDDPLLMVKLSEQAMILKHFTINDKIIAYSQDGTKYEDTIQLETLYDKINDDFTKGKCCSNIEKKEYPGCKGDTCPTNKSNLPLEVASNYCVEILNQDKYLWRVCTDNKSLINKIHTEISLNILKIVSGGKLHIKNLQDFMVRNLAEINSDSDNYLKNWNWDNQKKWKGECSSKKSLQSPINIDTKNLSQGKVSDIQFGIDYEFNEAHTLIKKHFNEINVHFKESAGILKLWVDQTSLLFQPQYMSFKFPGEHLINNKRYPGEIVIHFNEMNPNKKTQVSNGLVITVPLNPNKDNLSLDFFEKLNPDFWKLGLNSKSGEFKEYEPKKLYTKIPLKFSLSDLLKSATSQSPSYYTYIGSQTTPPCISNVIYIVIDKPLEISNCQFKVLRDNSLLTDRPKEIHARLPQNIKGRKIYQMTQVRFSPEIKVVIPELLKKFKLYQKIIMGGKSDKCKDNNVSSSSVIKIPIKRKNNSSKELRKNITQNQFKDKEKYKINLPEFKGENSENCDKI